MKLFANNSRLKKFNISKFTALKWKAKDFVSVARSILKRSLTAVLTVIVLANFLTNPQVVDSKKPESRPVFGTNNTLRVYPSSIDYSDWAGAENVLVSDLSEESLYQRFDEDNSAYIALEEEEVVLPGASASSSASENVSSDTQSDGQDAQVDGAVPAESELETVSEPEPQPQPEPAAEQSSEEVSTKSLDKNFASLLKSSMLTWLPVALATTTDEVSNEPEVVNEPEPEPVVTEEQPEVPSEPNAPAETEPEIPVVIETSAAASSANEEEVPAQPELVVETPEGVTDEEFAESVTFEETGEATTDASTTITFEDDAASTSVATSTSSTTEESLADMSARDNFETFSISLSDFAVPELRGGEQIVSVQLRASVGAKYKMYENSALPEINLTYHNASSSQSVGAIIIDDEVSNAINGGYQLFALPQMTDTEELENISIEVTFEGEVDLVRGVFLDSLWLEVETVTVTEDDLKNRADFELKQKLKEPSSHEFISEQIDFARGEAPVFNLRYVSQRSAPVEAVRSFFGVKKVKIEEAVVKHRTAGTLGISPEVNVTSEGLVSVVIPEEQLTRFKPGLYTVELTMNEGGKRVTDTFEFQWGLLSINPNQTQYQVGDMANFYMGALTPNGNTLCSADLRLYIIDDGGFADEVSVEQSGLCNGNNVIDRPDYSAKYELLNPGWFTMYLEHLDETGEVIAHTQDTFEVVSRQDYAIVRDGPTRIYPPATYPMKLTVKAVNEAFTGTITERVPADFKVTNTSADIKVRGDYMELSWDVSLLAGTSKSFSYTFDAPDISPYLYLLGPAELESKGGVGASSTPAGGVVFTEHRQWQIASDAVGNMILFWDDGASIPTGWSCVSCGSGDFYQNFAVGSSTYGNTGGSATHTHTGTGSVLASSDGATESGAGTIAPTSHGHTYSPTIGATSSLPLYRELRVIQYDTAGEPVTIPAGAIGIFDVASSSLPTDWNRYVEQDGYYIYGGDVPGTIGGSNEHTHSITGTTGASDGTPTRVRGGGTPAGAASDGHVHTVSTTTPLLDQQPPYVEVVLAKLATDGAAPNNLITMWSEELPSGWVSVSSSTETFENKFLKASTSYGTSGGAESHSHSDMTGITSSLPDTTTTSRIGSAGISDTHTHSVSVTSFSTTVHLPPYVTAVFGKRQGTDPVYDQKSFQWYVNEENLTPSDPWPVGATDLSEGETITATSTELLPGDEIRLRINAEVTNATSTAGSEFKLQFAAADSCISASNWLDVGDISSTTVWRGYNNALTDHATLPSQLLTDSTVSETYEENGYSSTTPNEIGINEVGEWDFVLSHNGALPGTNYCFRMVEIDGSVFSTYTKYPQLITNAAPVAPTLSRLFDNELTPTSTATHFRFVSTDPEGEDIQYQIQIDNNYDFGSTLEDKNSISNSSQFENLVVSSDKAPFTSGQLMQFTASASFTNGTTYYWRVRGRDTAGSNQWGDWSEIRSFTIDNTLTASAWFQTEDEQFDTDTLVGVETGSDSVSLISGSTTGTITSTAITFTDGLLGTAWDSFEFNDVETSGDIKYTLQYLDDGASWTNIPDSDLSGNSAGFDSSPVSLLALDVDTYSTIRIVATLTNSGGSPTLQDWTIKWGYRVETPTISRLFPNEKTSTTTPLFEFTTTDPQSDSLTYQVSWSTDYTFTASTTKTSGVDSGFSNFDDGLDSDPFTSGDTIQFQMQGGDALTNNTTYWWRVRAKDTTGDDQYSFWTDPQSFTVDTTVIASTWFQTTEEQFDTDVLSGTDALTSDAVSVATTATEAMLVYGEGTETIPRYRQWNGSSWSAEGTLADVGAPISWVRVEAGVNREEYIAVTSGTDGDVNAQVFALGAWSDLQEVTSSMGNVAARGFDVAYETLSGDALVVYCDGDADPSYYVWNGSTWRLGTSTLNLAETTNCEWIQLASDPTSDEIIVLSRGVDGIPYEAQVWDGDNWGNSTTQGLISETGHEGMSVAYEESGNQALILTSDGNPGRFRWNSWNGTTWGTAATQSIGNDFEWGTLVADKGTDEMAVCYVDQDLTIGTARWNGTAWAWSAADEHTTTGYSKTDPAFACVYEDGGARDNYILTTYSDTTVTASTSYNGTTWSTGQQIQSIGPTATAELQRTGTGHILGIFFDDTNDDLLYSGWDGSSWSSTQTIENDASVDTPPHGRPYSVGPRNSGTEGTVIVSPAIDFTDGSGPYWKEMSWVDSTPGTSDILYSMQYYDGDSWEFIPDSAIPNNSIGTSTGVIDLSGLNTVTYRLIRPYAALSCDGASNCPELQDWTVKWAEGITVSGNLKDYTQTTDITSGTVAVAVNGVLEVGKTGTVDGSGNWSISNVTAFGGDVITVFISGATDDAEAVGVTRYDGTSDITGFQLYERHVTLGSDDATSTPLTNADIAGYNSTDDEDVFININGSRLDLCTDVGCDDVRFYINASTTYRAGGDLVTHDVDNYGTLVATTTLFVSGSWNDAATSTLTNSTVVFSATSTTESVDQTGALTPAFNNVTFGTTTTVSAVWNLTDTLDVNGDLTVELGTLGRNTQEITVAGDLVTGTNGLWTGIGTTTFDGSSAANWADQNAPLQNVGRVVVDGTGKNVTLSGNVAAQTITIGADDVLDASGTHFDITVYGDWTNNGSFVARNGEVFFAATTAGHNIDVGGDSFYDLSFTGIDGSWSFVESDVTVGNDLTVATGTVTLPTATTSVGGSFSSAGGTFAHNNGAIDFTGSGVSTITASGTAFTNNFYDLYFSGSGSWVFQDVNATSSNDVRVTSGTLTLPTGVMAVGGSFLNTAGVVSGNGGTLKMYAAGAENITFGGSSLASLLISGAGSFTITDTNAGLSGDLTVSAGTLTLPSGELTIGGSLTNTATIDANGGLVTFDSADAGESISMGASSFYDLDFDSVTGGWTIVGQATATNDVSLTNANDWTLNSGLTMSVAGVFTNSIGASTTWSGSILSLESGAYSLNTKTVDGDQYETLRIAANTDIKMWNSAATTTTVGSGGSLYSQDHAGNNGDLYIYGDFVENTSNVYWSHETDFDGTDLGTTSARQVDVYFASGATASISDVLFEMVGSTTASTTVQNQGSGTYTIDISGGTTTAQYYSFADLGLSGLSLLASTTVTSLRDGAFIVAADGGTAITLSSTTIDSNPAKQIYNVDFATTTAISATNVTQIDGAATSYWWFRSSTGNLQGENYDNDLGPIAGNPGTVRWDDSALSVTIAGTVYESDEATPLTTSTCGTGNPVTVVVEGGGTHVGACNGADGSFSISGVTVVGDPTLTIYLDGADNGEQAVTLTKTVTADVLDLDLYVNRVIVRHEDVDPMTIDDMAAYDYDNDNDIPFLAATTTDPDVLTLLGNTELHIWATTTFTPGGDIELYANATADDWDGTLHIGEDATFTGAGTNTYTIGGSINMESGGTFVPASTIVVMNATTTGKTINTAAGEKIDLNELQFTGAGGGWNLNGNASTTDDVWVSAGTLSGTGDLTINNGSLYGNGTVSMGGGEITLVDTNTFGGTQPWLVHYLTLGDGGTLGTTTPAGTATTTVSGVLTINNAHYLDAGNSHWLFSGADTVFVETGTFLEDTSTVTYGSLFNTNVLSTDYYNLTFESPLGTQTATATGAGIQVWNDLNIIGAGNMTVDFNENDTALNVDGNFNIESVGTFIASDSGLFTLAGSYDNNGTFTANGGTLTLDGSGVATTSAGASDFANIDITGTGQFVFDEHATATTAFTIGSNASLFTLEPNIVLAVGGTFSNELGGANTVWTNSVLALYGGGNYEINASTTDDVYGTLVARSGTQIRMWNSSAATVTTETNASVYSMDHANSGGQLYIYGDYTKSSGSDYWSRATDFDGTDITGSERTVSVFVENGSLLLYSGGSLEILGEATASTTIQNQGAGTYSFAVTGGTLNANYYEISDTDSDGLSLSGTPTVTSLSYGKFTVGANNYRALTISGSVITANPAKTFTGNTFATSSGVTTAYNSSSTGSTASGWKFTNHLGDIDGEAFDLDLGPNNGNPGYVSWDNSSSTIVISGTVYADEGTTVSSACDGSTQNIRMIINGVTSTSTSCNGNGAGGGTGAYSFAPYSYPDNSTIIVYIDNEATHDANTITYDPFTTVGDLDLYENRIIVRHEGSDALTITEMGDWDNDTPGTEANDMLYTANGSLVIDSDTKLIVWDNKEFAPGGDVTISGGGAGADYDGTLELYSDATYTTTAGEVHTIGGSLISQSGAVYDASTATTTFTTTGASRTVDTNDGGFYNVAFTGSGSWTVSDSFFDVNNFTQTAGSLTLSSGTTTVSGYWNASAGSFDINGSTMVFDGAGSNNTVVFSGSDVAELQFTGSGSWTMDDVNATATKQVTIDSGSLTLPSGSLWVGGSFINNAGTVTHNTSLLTLSTTSVASLQASSSDLYGVTFAGGGTFTIVDEDITLADTLTITSGAVTLASGTLSIGGSFDASGGTFDHASGTILFNSVDTGETIDPGVSNFANVQFGSVSGGWTITSDATTTGNFSLVSANDFTQSANTVLAVHGVFSNAVGGAATTWTNTELKLLSGTDYSINSKSVGGDAYQDLFISSGMDIGAWDTSAASVTFADYTTSSLYSRDHSGVDGYLYIYGTYNHSTSTLYWNYSNDFDGAALVGPAQRDANIFLVAAATSSFTMTAGNLEMIGDAVGSTTIDVAGAGTYAFDITGGTLSAQYYEFSGFDAGGVTFTGTPTLVGLSNGGFEVGVNTGTAITLSSTTLNANASKILSDVWFATTTAISATNVTLSGSSISAWRFLDHYGNLSGEDYDVDGASGCGSIRWDDSSCLLTEQTYYRWRNDDGGLGAPDTEWFDSNWGKRQSVRLYNSINTDYNDAVVEIEVAYDADMQSDFDDLRFTDSDGITELNYFIASSTNGTMAEVWVEVPTLAARTTTILYMYYDNVVATSNSSSTATFIAADDFEDNDIAEYSGDTGIFNTAATYAYGGSYGLDNNGNEGTRATDGIARFDQTVSQGETIRYMQYVTDNGSDEVCTMFGVQSPVTSNTNYGVCLEQFNGDRVSIVENVESTDSWGSVSLLSSSTLTFATGWYEVEIDWGSDGSMFVSVYDDNETLQATTSATDISNSSGGYGFTYWGNNGGWDNFSSRPTLAAEPTVTFGAETLDGGASWAAAANTAATFNGGDVARLRVAVENTGLATTSINLDLEYAVKGAAPSCESVSAASFNQVPVQASCGSSAICMQTTANYANNTATTDLLMGTFGTFTAGQAIEDPSNTTGNIDIDQNEFTEIEYAIEMTLNATDDAYCFRVTSSGSELDSYTYLPEIGVTFDPVLTGVTLNGGLPITLSAGTTTEIYATGTVTDLNGPDNLNTATATIYRSGAGAACTADDNDCYISAGTTTCSFLACSGNSCTVSCVANFAYHADPTDAGAYEGEEWFVFLEVEDDDGGVDFDTSLGNELLTLRALDIDNEIAYGSYSIFGETATGSNPMTAVKNYGNVAFDIEVSGTAMTDGGTSSIDPANQRFSTSTFGFSSCASCSVLSGAGSPLEIDLTKPTTSTPYLADDVYWGIRIPFGTAGAPHSGTNTFTPVAD